MKSKSVMEQFEKVHNGLECCCYIGKSPKHCEGCPYNRNNEGCKHNAFALKRDALVLIRQQQERIKELEASDASWNKFVQSLYAQQIVNA